MTDLNLHDPLHGVVHGALLEDAKRAPQLRTEWSDADVELISPTDGPRPRRLVAISIAAALVLIATLAVAARPGDRDDKAPSTAPSMWTPDGTEFPLTDLGPATAGVYGGPFVAALTRQVGVDGHPPQVITTSLEYMGTDTAVEYMCTSERGSAGCRPGWLTPTWSTSITSSVDNGYADYDLWTVEGLPAGAAFVSYADGDQLLWQRPIMGFAAFPNVAGSNETVIAYDASGTAIGRFDDSAIANASNSPRPLMADISKEDFGILSNLTREEMTKCLTVNGGTFNGTSNVAIFAEDVDQLAVWTQCVTTVQQVVTDAVGAINPRYYDPATERPENPDSPFKYVN